MYDDMTLEEMIQRLYKGSFTTGELERQLIAEIFMRIMRIMNSYNPSGQK